MSKSSGGGGGSGGGSSGGRSRAAASGRSRAAATGPVDSRGKPVPSGSLLSSARTRTAYETQDVSGRTMQFKARGVDGGYVQVSVHHEGKKIAWVGFSTPADNTKGLTATYVTTDPAFRRQGIASRMYEFAERMSGRQVVQASTQTDMGKPFNEAYRRRRDAKK